MDDSQLHQIGMAMDALLARRQAVIEWGLCPVYSSHEHRSSGSASAQRAQAALCNVYLVRLAAAPAALSGAFRFRGAVVFLSFASASSFSFSISLHTQIGGFSA